MERKTIKISGEASCSMKPDICTISFTAISSDVDYSECVDALNEEVNIILKKVKSMKIDKESLTTKDFKVIPNRVYDEDLKEYVFVNYIGEHRIDIKIDNDSKLINKVLTTLNGNEFTHKVDISFGIKDESQIKEKALKMAIEKAKTNAEIIASGLGIKLGEVLDIKYNFSDRGIGIRNYEYLEDMTICDNSCDFNIMPEDCNYSESISLVWEIKN